MVDVKKLLQTGGHFLQKNAPAVLTGLGITGFVSTVFLGCHATAKSKDVITELEYCEYHETGLRNVYSSKEKFLLCWKYYIPTVVTGGLSIACVVGAQSVNSKRYAALASLYALSETAFADFKKEAAQYLKPKELDEIRENIAQKHLDDHPYSPQTVIDTGKGTHLCFDVVSSRYFKSDIETIRRLENRINKDVLNSELSFVDLNYLYYELGLEPIKYGDYMGWDIYDLLDFKFDSKLLEDGTPCMVIDYDVIPKTM